MMTPTFPTFLTIRAVLGTVLPASGLQAHTVHRASHLNSQLGVNPTAKNGGVP